MFRNKNIAKIILSSFIAIVALSLPIASTVQVFAASSGSGTTATGCDDGSTPDSSGLCADKTQPINTTPIPNTTDTDNVNAQCSNSNCDLVSKYVQPLSDFLAAGVGIIVVINVVIGGIQYSASQDNPQAVSAAKGRIVNALIALLVFGFMWALLQWLAPGGIF